MKMLNISIFLLSIDLSLYTISIIGFQSVKTISVIISFDFYTLSFVVFVASVANDVGSVIIFDDWYNFKSDPNKGEQKACKEWLQKNSHIKWKLARAS